LRTEGQKFVYSVTLFVIRRTAKHKQKSRIIRVNHLKQIQLIAYYRDHM
jgi:hypothetical protein